MLAYSCSVTSAADAAGQGVTRPAGGARNEQESDPQPGGVETEGAFPRGLHRQQGQGTVVTHMISYNIEQ